MFNSGDHALAVAVASGIYFVAGGTIQPEEPLTAIVPTLLAGISYFFVETILLTGAIALTEHSSFRKTWEANFRWSIFNFVALALVGPGL